jgi:hypothetical protein
MFNMGLKGDYVIEISLDTKGFIRNIGNAFGYILAIDKNVIHNLHFTKIIKFKSTIERDKKKDESQVLNNAVFNPTPFSCYVLLIGNGFNVESFCRLMPEYNSNKQIIGSNLLFLPDMTKIYHKKNTKIPKNNYQENIEYKSIDNQNLIVNAFNNYYNTYYDKILKQTRDILFSCNFADTIQTNSIKTKLTNVTQDIAKLQKLSLELKNYSDSSSSCNVVNILDILKDSISMLYSSLGINELNYLKFSSENIDDYNVYLNTIQVTKAFFYILQNAYEFSLVNSKREISINVSVVKKKNIVITISNNGEKINHKDSKLIYNPFFSTKTQTNNNALSLYYAKIILCNNHDMSLKNYNLKHNVVFEIAIKI